MSYQQDTPVAPRFDVNAPDLYIPAMAFITYVLVAGLALGTQNRYTYTRRLSIKLILVAGTGMLSVLYEQWDWLLS